MSQRRAILVFAVCAAAAFASPASADTYRFLSQDDEGAATFIDETSINRMADTATVWTLTITAEYMKGATPKTAYYLMQQWFNCRSQRFRPTAMSTYSDTGASVSSDDKGAEEGPIEPGTIEQGLYKRICFNERGKNGTFEGKSPLAVAVNFRNDVLSVKK